MNKALDDSISAALPEVVALRHELHAHPEIRFEEQWTAERIARFLEGAAIAVSRGHAKGTGIVATVTGSPGKTLVLRADIDALELDEETLLPYASEIPHRMHACGHDGHVACLCGAAKVLQRHAQQLRGTVKFIFQPAEELGAGGRLIVEDGLLDNVDAAFALHTWPGIPVGKVGLKSGPMMASADWFRIDVRGRGAHGADPAASVDPVIAAAHITTALQTIVSREINPWDAAVVTVARIQAGVATNIIPETARIEGTSRALTPEVRAALLHAISRIAEGTAAALRASVAVHFGADCYAPLVNDPAMTALARDAIRDALGPDSIVDIEHPSMASEDFAFYLQRVPGAFLWLGNGSPLSLHNARFDFNDDALEVGMRVFAALALHFLR